MSRRTDLTRPVKPRSDVARMPRYQPGRQLAHDMGPH